MKLVCGNCGSGENVVESVRVYANELLNSKSGLYYKFYDSEDALMCVECSLSNIITAKEYQTIQMDKVSKEADAAMERYTKKLKKEAKQWEKSKDT